MGSERPGPTERRHRQARDTTVANFLKFFGVKVPATIVVPDSQTEETYRNTLIELDGDEVYSDFGKRAEPSAVAGSGSEHPLDPAEPSAVAGSVSEHPTDPAADAAVQLAGPRAGKVLPEVLRPRDWNKLPPEERRRLRQEASDAMCLFPPLLLRCHLLLLSPGLTRAKIAVLCLGMVAAHQLTIHRLDGRKILPCLHGGAHQLEEL